ncbi:hypothetical protein ACN38_g11991 [Penicillium nordicum]|uniref:Uncharacterized protein n=1 Tax=Penicillium nordicum TaxID=229535 RepID=A0A0M8NXW0_9EURO|nr:hypothetical protein ACN38_g11991 [Penicillium nordicum]
MGVLFFFFFFFLFFPFFFRSELANGLVVVAGLTVDTLSIYTSHLTGSVPPCSTDERISFVNHFDYLPI